MEVVSMETKFNYYWGLLGILGLLGYVLENPVYYVFFGFFLLFLVPDFNKPAEKSGKKESDIESNYNMYKLSIWIGSAALIVDSVVLIIWKTMNDFVAIGLLLGILIYGISFFAYIGIDKTSRDERLRKIGTYSATYSWYITLIFVIYLLITMYWGQNIHNPIELMGVTIFVMVSSMLVANTVLSRRGDIE